MQHLKHALFEQLSLTKDRLHVHRERTSAAPPFSPSPHAAAFAPAWAPAPAPTPNSAATTGTAAEARALLEAAGRFLLFAEGAAAPARFAVTAASLEDAAGLFLLLTATFAGGLAFTVSASAFVAASSFFATLAALIFASVPAQARRATLRHRAAGMAHPTANAQWRSHGCSNARQHVEHLLLGHPVLALNRRHVQRGGGRAGGGVAPAGGEERAAAPTVLASAADTSSCVVDSFLAGAFRRRLGAAGFDLDDAP